MSVSKSLRYQVLRRDDHTCRYCGRSAPEVKLTIDHVTPTTLGGSDEASNLVTACVECNSGKSATPPDAALVDDVSELAVRWSAAQKMASTMLAGARAQRDEIREAFEAAWKNWTYKGDDGERHPIELPNSWPNSIDTLALSGLTIEDLEDAVDIAMRTEKAADRFRYFCGVAWRMSRELQDTTRRLLDNDEQRGAPEAPLGSAASKIRCPECSSVVELVIEVLPTRPEEPIRLRSQALGADPWGVSKGLVPLGKAVEAVISGWQQP